MSSWLDHPLRLPVRSSNSFFLTRYRSLRDHLHNIQADLFLMRVDKLKFIRFLFRLIPCLDILVVTPSGSCFFVPITALGIVRFVI
jgi:hypothetical protein